MKKIDVILKVTDKCNLRCKYCYNSKTGYGDKVLPLEYFEKLLYLLVESYDTVRVVWHGGEPLCAGIDYFKKAIDIEQKIKFQYGIPIENSIQTNGTLITKEFADLFKKNDFKVGISYDGLENDKYRQQGNKVLEAFKLLRKNKVKFGCLAVVADEDYDLLANYKFFAENNIPVDFNYLFPEGEAKKLSGVKAKAFADKMCELFDYWLYDKKGVDVRTFSFYLNTSIGGCARVCANSSCHGKYLGLCPDGTLQNCGRDSVSAYPFVNVMDIDNINQAFASKGAIDLFKGSIARRNKCKESCELYSVCQGGCADCAIWDSGLENIPESSCIIFKTLYAKIRDTFKEVMEKKIPLTDLNPSIKYVLSSKFIRFDASLKGTLAGDYLQLWMKP